jgi:hypothetical protein
MVDRLANLYTGRLFKEVVAPGIAFSSILSHFWTLIAQNSPLLSVVTRYGDIQL